MYHEFRIDKYKHHRKKKWYQCCEDAHSDVECLNVNIGEIIWTYLYVIGEHIEFHNCWTTKAGIVTIYIQPTT